MNECFLLALHRFVADQLLPQVTIPYKRVEGTLQASFDNDKNCGPNSAIRNLYNFTIKFVEPRLFAKDRCDEFSAEIRYSSETETFQHRFGKPLVLWTDEKKKRLARSKAQIQSIIDSALHGRQEQFCCPACNASIRIIDNDHLFDVSCEQHCFTYSFHRNPKTREFVHGHFYMRQDTHGR